MENGNKKIQKLIEVAQMYYEQDLTQSEISQKLGVSRPLVSRMLNEAKDLGIVTIQVHSSPEGSSELLNQLRNRYNLRGGVIVPDAGSENATDQQIAAHIRDFLQGMSPAITKMGIGWGSILGAFTKLLEKNEPKKKFCEMVFPLIGNSSVSNRDYHSNELVRVIAEKCGAEPCYLYAPAFLETEQEKRHYEESESFKHVESGWNDMDTALINLGNYPSSPDDATATRFGDLLVTRKAAGRLLCSYFDGSGAFIQSETDYTMQVPLTRLARCRNVIAVGSATLQARALVGALRSGLITHVIVAENVARQALEVG